MLEKRQKEKLTALRDMPKQTLLEKNAKVDKCLCEFKLQSIANNKILFYAGAVVVTNSLGLTINKAAERREPVWSTRLQNKIKEFMKDLSQLDLSKDKKFSNVSIDKY